MVKKNDIGTEEQIKKAATKLFLERGFDGTSIRDIAEAAGSNVALLNYYFRSKQRLYDLIVKDLFDDMFRPALEIFDGPDASISEMMYRFVDVYVDYFGKHANLPFFVADELRRNPQGALEAMPVDKLGATRFVAMLGDSMKEKVGEVPYYVHLILNALSMLVIPAFLAPALKSSKQFGKDAYAEMVAARKQMIPIWINSMIEMV